MKLAQIAKKYFPLNQTNINALIVLLVFVSIFAYYKSWDPRPFSSPAWIATGGEGNHKTRYAMREGVRDFLEDNRPDMKQVTALLGPPDFQFEPFQLKYKLGKGPFLSWVLGDLTLTIAFEDNGKYRGSAVADPF